MKVQKWLMGVILIAGSLWLQTGHVVQAEGASFSVSPQIPENQRSAVSNYYDLVVKPGTTQNLSLSVTNRTAEVRHVRLSVTDAWSQSNGQVSYSPGAPADDSAEHRLTDLGPAPMTLTLAPKEVKTVTVPLKIPPDGFRGVLLGALYLVDNERSGGEESGGVAIKNRFATVVGVQLQTSTGAINGIVPHLKLLRVGAGVHDNQPSVLATLQNDRPTYWGKMRLKATVTKRDQKTVVMQREAANYAVAPNSHFNFAVTNQKALDPGDYTLNLAVTGPHGHWQFRRNFSILVGEADSINKEVGLKRRFVMPWWGWALIGLALLVVVAACWWVLHRPSKSLLRERREA